MALTSIGAVVPIRVDEDQISDANCLKKTKVNGEIAVLVIVVICGLIAACLRCAIERRFV